MFVITLRRDVWRVLFFLLPPPFFFFVNPDARRYNKKKNNMYVGTHVNNSNVHALVQLLLSNSLDSTRSNSTLRRYYRFTSTMDDGQLQ